MADSKVLPISSTDEEFLERIARLQSGGGGNNSGGMEPRLAKLEARADGIEKRLDDIKGDIARVEHRLISMMDAQLTKWDVAQVVIYVMGALMAAIVLGPRIISMLAP